MAAAIILPGPVQASGDINFGGFKATNLATPTAGTDGATKAYVDAKGPGIIVGTGVAGRPVAPQGGQGYWRLDKNFLETYDGTNWRVFGTVVVSALTDITSPYSGQQVVHSGDNYRLWQYDGSTWNLYGLLTNQQIGGEWVNTLASPNGQAMNTSGATKLNFPTLDKGTGFGLTQSGGNTWTNATDGLYWIDCQFRLTTTVAGGVSIGLTTYSDATLLIPTHHPIQSTWGDQGVTAPIWLTSGTVFCAWFFNNTATATSIASPTRLPRIRIWGKIAA